ncbi:hypothetical protein Llab_1202 [Lactococcus lactis]|nr:hypothetical protein Llab_1202 [Lactococcus lactis]
MNKAKRTILFLFKKMYTLDTQPALTKNINLKLFESPIN